MGSRYRLQSRTTDRGRRCHRILPQPSRHGLHEQECVLQLAGLSLFLLRMTMARILLLAVILLAPTSKTSPRLQDYSHHNFNSVLNEVPSKGTREEGSSFKPTQLLLKPTLGCGLKLYFLVIVHSAPNHFRERALIRDTWGSVAALAGWQVKVVFMLGLAGDDEFEDEGEAEQRNSVKSRSLHSFPRARHSHRAESVNWLVGRESAIEGDILQGNFTDNLSNQIEKHIMGYNWVSAVYGFSPGPSLVCDVIPAGTGPHRTSGRPNLLSVHRHLPKYCSGAAYLVTPSLISKFLKAAQKVERVAMDDVFMTGIVRQKLKVSPFYLNLRYTYQTDQAEKWVRSRKRSPLPYIFVVPPNKDRSKWPRLVREMWQKTEEIQGDYPK